jgi:3-phosphoshikimate 1-carboxyvinyltransferase
MNHHDQTIRVRSGAALNGSVSVPGDKSLSHRALILGALSDGASHVRNFLPAGDTLATLGCMRALGIAVEQHDTTTLTVHGRGLNGLQAPASILNCVHAGTAIRLLAGVMAGQPFASVLDGSSQLRRRPMRRVTDPLRQMGALIADTNGCAPLHISPALLRGMTYTMPVASAQVKSGVLLAGLFADGPTTIIEPGPARDHTERMLRARGADVRVDGACVTITPGGLLQPLDLVIPGDISSAAFVLVAAILAAEGDVTIQGIGVNPTRTGILDILAAMGAAIRQTNLRDEGGEPVADLVVGRASLNGAQIGGEVVVRAIDEFPALMVAATQAAGETIVSDAAELRVKETDRIAVMTGELRKLGAEITERPDGFQVIGPQKLRGAVVDGHDDHRVAMALTVAGLVADGETIIQDAGCVNDSFPGFVETLQALSDPAKIEWYAEERG